MSAPAHVPAFYDDTLAKESSTNSLNSALVGDVAAAMEVPEALDITDECVNEDEMATGRITSGPPGPSGKYKAPSKGRIFRLKFSLAAFTHCFHFSTRIWL